MKTAGMKAYVDLTWPDRLKIRQLCELCGSQFHHATSAGFRVAIGRGQFATTCALLEKSGFKCVDLFTFPLGSDKPEKHLRHDHNGFEFCCWLFADFTHGVPE